MTPEHPVQVLVITALGLERAAIAAHLQGVQAARFGDTTCDLGVLKDDGVEISVAIIETGPGNIDAATTTRSALSNLHPSVALLAGIAGRQKDLGIGDVVAASKVYWVEPGKELVEADGGKGKQRSLTRPSFGPVSHRLVQTARAVAAAENWLGRRKGVEWSPELSSDTPRAVVAPIAAVEKVIADTETPLAQLIARDFSDAVAVAMEDAGAMRAVATQEVAAAISVRGISDLLRGKSDAEKLGSQELAAANAAAFAVELIVLDARLSKASSRNVGAATELTSLAAELYPSGPRDRAVWQRAGGDLSRITLEGAGDTQWWSALRHLELGGGGGGITLASLLQAMVNDFPNHDDLVALSRNELGPNA